MTLNWRTEAGKQPAVILSDDTATMIAELKECLQQGHRVLDAFAVKGGPRVLTLKGEHSYNGFFLDDAGNDCLLVLTRWNSGVMVDAAYDHVTERMRKIALEIKEHRERMGQLTEAVHSWRASPGVIIPVEEAIEPVLVDFSPGGSKVSEGFREELRVVLNKHSKDTATGMPDFVLASLVSAQIESLAEAQVATHDWKNS